VNIPNQVKVGPYVYPVSRPYEVKVDGKLCWGHISYNPQCIEIQEEISEERAAVAFFHECLHAIDDAWSVGLSEKQTDRLAVGLTTFLRENGLLKEDG
jgi:hypothetical protein